MFGLHTEELLTKIATLQEENAHLCRTIIQLFKDDNLLKEQYEALMRQNQDLFEQQSHDRQEVRELQETVRNLVDEKAELQEQHKHDQRSIRDQVSSNSMLRREFDDLKFELGKFREYVNLPFVQSVISRMPSLQEELKGYADRKQKIQGLKAIRAATNCDLKTAKEAWEHFEAELQSTAKSQTNYDEYDEMTEAIKHSEELQRLLYDADNHIEKMDDIIAEVRVLLDEDKKLQACKVLRQETGVHLVTSLQFINEYFADHPTIKESPLEEKDVEELLPPDQSYREDLQRLHELAEEGSIQHTLEIASDYLDDDNSDCALYIIIEHTGCKVKACVHFLAEHFKNHPTVKKLGPLNPADYPD